ncbi:hypothetical protein HY642_00695, partial [Candidatus Woesearchaeota archaeon]|nr:hypothetical protein [Candidatus Woesearchaeota archaeon]
DTVTQPFLRWFSLFSHERFQEQLLQQDVKIWDVIKQLQEIPYESVIRKAVKLLPRDEPWLLTEKGLNSFLNQFNGLLSESFLKALRSHKADLKNMEFVRTLYVSMYEQGVADGRSQTDLLRHQFRTITSMNEMRITREVYETLTFITDVFDQCRKELVSARDVRKVLERQIRSQGRLTMLILRLFTIQSALRDDENRALVYADFLALERESLWARVAA